MAIQIAKSGCNVNTNFSDGIENSGRFEYGSPVRLRLDFLNLGFRLRSLNYAATSQSDYRHRSGNLSHRSNWTESGFLSPKKQERRRIIRAGR
jgi:hypothetical protein